MTRETDPERLHRRWTHSHEEDEEGAFVFRPSDYPFPPSRGRVSYELAPDGVLLSTGIGPDDRPTSEAGSWSLEDEGQRLVLRPAGQTPRYLHIRSLDEDRMVVTEEGGPEGDR